MSITAAFTSVSAIDAGNISPVLQGFLDDAKAMTSLHERDQKFSEMTYIRALLEGDDNLVIAGVRINSSGRGEGGDALSGSVRAVNRLLMAMMMQDVAADLEQLMELQAELYEARSVLNDMLEEHFTKEEIDALPPEGSPERHQAIRDALRKKLENGEMSQEAYDEVIAQNDRENDLSLQVDAMIQELADNNEIVAALLVAQEQHKALLAERSEIEGRLNRYEGVSRKLMELRGKDRGEITQGLDVLLVEHGDLDITIPADLSPEEAIDYVQTQVSEAAAIDSAAAVEIVDQIEVAEAVEARIHEEASQEFSGFADIDMFTAPDKNVVTEAPAVNASYELGGLFNN